MINIKTNVKKRITFDDIGSTTSFGKKKTFLWTHTGLPKKSPEQKT